MVNGYHDPNAGGKLTRGISIVRMKDGTVRKVLVK